MAWSAKIAPALALIWFASSAVAGNAKFVDLTARKYKGPDSDLSGLAINDVGFGCDGNSSDSNAQGPTYISWNGSNVVRSTEQRSKSKFSVKQSQLEAFKIHFRLIDRSGAVALEKTFRYLRNFSEDHDGGIVNDASKCERPMARFGEGIKIPYGHVEWWLSDIKWADYNRPTDNPDRIAITLDAQLKAVQPQSEDSKAVDPVDLDKADSE